VDPLQAPAIQIENLVKRYGRVSAVNGITFSVGRGEIVGFLGPNGAGKSTTLRILSGYIPASGGSVSICGLSVASQADEVKRRIGYMPENNPLPEDLRVGEYLNWRARLKEIPRRLIAERVDHALEVCDLTRSRRRIIGKLSKGFRQRVGVADAILAQPDVIIMDEPTIGLDPHQIIMIRDLISSFRGRMAVLISSHILPEIEATCDRVVIINGGRIVAQGAPASLRHEFIGRDAYDLELAGDPQKLQAELALVSPDLLVDEEGLPGADGFRRIRLSATSDRDWGEALLGALSRRPELRLRSLARREATLEEVFLAATRRSYDAVLPSSALKGAEEPAETISPAGR
jgi:ABC-2 type transport system ATP-binding protein